MFAFHSLTVALRSNIAKVGSPNSKKDIFHTEWCSTNITPPPYYWNRLSMIIYCVSFPSPCSHTFVLNTPTGLPGMTERSLAWRWSGLPWSRYSVLTIIWYSVIIHRCNSVLTLPWYSVLTPSWYGVLTLPCYSVLIIPFYSMLTIPCYSVRTIPFYSMLTILWSTCSLHSIRHATTRTPVTSGSLAIRSTTLNRHQFGL